MKHFNELPAKFALLFPGCSAGNRQKRWPVERYRALVAHFASLGLKSVVAGTKAESEEISAICEGNPDAVDFMGKTSIADIPALALSAAVTVGNDTGPVHIARIAGAKTVILFTDYDYGRAAPKNPPPGIVCLHGRRIEDIPEADVAAAADGMLFGKSTERQNDR